MKKKITTTLLAIGASAVTFAQNVTLNGALDQADSILRSNANRFVNVVSLIIGLIGIAMLGWQGAKYLKGDGNSNDALMKIAGGMLIIAILLQVIKAIFIGA